MLQVQRTGLILPIIVFHVGIFFGSLLTHLRRVSQKNDLHRIMVNLSLVKLNQELSVNMRGIYMKKARRSSVFLWNNKGGGRAKHERRRIVQGEGMQERAGRRKGITFVKIFYHPFYDQVTFGMVKQMPPRMWRPNFALLIP